MFRSIVLLLLVVYVIITTTLLNIIEVRGHCGFFPFPYQKFWFFFGPVALRPNAGNDVLIVEASRPHTMTHHTRFRTPLDE